MSYYYGHQYSNPFSATPGNRHPQFNFFNQGPPPPHHFGSRHPYHIYRQHPFFAAQHFFDDDEEHYSPSPSPAPSAPRQSIDEEEQAALAHLEAIRKRKAAEQESIKREAEARLKDKRDRDREIAIQRAIAEKEREEAIARLVRQQEEEYARQLAIRKAIETQRAEEIQRRRQQYLAAQEAKQRYIQEAIARKAECAKRHAARYAAHASRQAAKEAQKQYGGEFEQLNKMLGGLFGINLAPSEDVDERSEVKEEEKKEVKEKKEIHFNQPQSTPAPASTEKKDTSFPEGINDILGQFLGLRVETTESGPPSGSTENKVPAGLNEFLSQFGLVFEPLESDEKEEAKATPESSMASDQAPAADPEVPALSPPATNTAAPVATPVSNSASSSSASSSVPKSAPPKVDDAPLTAFLNSFTDLPPFVRDILGNVELAFKEELSNKQQEACVEGKGKGVASGEKNPIKTSPTPNRPNSVETPPVVRDNSQSLDKLNLISSELDLVKDSFEFPSVLAFASTTTESTDIVPNLLYNKTNKSYHAQSNKLLQLLLDADSVESEGNKDVRRLRKEIVGKVEDAIKELEGRRDEIWKEVKERREKGEDFELWEDESSLSSRSSVVDIEHVEDVKGFEIEDNQTSHTVLFDAPVETEESKVENEDAIEENTEDKEERKQDRVDVKTVVEAPVGVKSPEEEAENVSDEGKTKEKKVEQDKIAKVEDAKEDGYELL